MRFGWAIALSVGAHALLGGGAAIYLAKNRHPDQVATLDLSSVDLSFAETEMESEPVQPLPPVPETEKPKTEPRPPEEPRCPPGELLPPDPCADEHLPEPEESTETLPEPPPLPPPAPPPPMPMPPAPAKAPRQAKVDAPPRPLRTIKPDYPNGARQRGEQGSVGLEIDVGADGRVHAARVQTSSGFAELDEAAVKAVRAARFTPAKSAGRAVESTARLVLQFKLR